MFMQLPFLALLLPSDPKHDCLGGDLPTFEIDGFLEAEGNNIGAVDALEDVFEEAEVVRVAIEGVRLGRIYVPGYD
jgi:hypothetical protein